MMQKFLSLLLFLGLPFLLPVSMEAQEKPAYPPMAAFGTDGNLRLYGFEEEPIQLTFQDKGLDKILWHPGGPLHDVVWSRDGKYLAFVSDDGHLALFDLESRQLKDLDIYPQKELPITFSRDSRYVLFGSFGDHIYETDYDDFFTLDISRISVRGDFAPEIVVSIGSVNGVYGGGPIPPARLIYQTEMGGYWRFGDRTLEDTPFGVVAFNGFGAHPESENQAVSPGINLYDLNGNALLGGQSLTNAVVSSDQKYLATIANEGIQIIDLETLERRSYKTSVPPDIVAWGGINQIFYTSIEAVRDLKAELSPEDKTALLSYLDYDFEPVTSNVATIHQFTLADGSEQEIYSDDVFAFGQLMVAPDGKNLFFSTIPNLDNWWQALLDRARNNDKSAFDEYELVRPSLYHFNLENRQVELIATGLYKAAINFPAYLNQLSNR